MNVSLKINKLLNKKKALSIKIKQNKKSMESWPSSKRKK